MKADNDTTTTLPSAALAATVIIASWNDGADHMVIRGREALDRIIAADKSEEHLVAFVSVASEDAARALLRRHGAQ
jgi:hypothetical protein